MKRFATIAMFAAMSTLAIARDDSADFKKFITAMIPKAMKAMEKKDMKFFDSAATKDFTEVMSGKTMTREQSMAQMKQMFDTSDMTSCSMKLLSATAKNGVGIAMTHDKFSATIKPMKKGDKKHTMTGEGWSKMTWVKTGKTWKLKMMEEAKPSKMTMDGKPFDPSKMGG